MRQLLARWLLTLTLMAGPLPLVAQPAAEPTRSFRHTARELLALSAWRNHDAAAARKYLDMIAGDAESPIGVRARADVLSALITADGKS